MQAKGSHRELGKSPRRKAAAKPLAGAAAQPLDLGDVHPPGRIHVLEQTPRELEGGLRVVQGAVGAITGEAGIESKYLGAIKVQHDHSLVEVPAAIADRIITALKKTTIRGKSVDVKIES